jgi:Reverse transcriptase (RNA-dependent DNA polymerase)
VQPGYSACAAGSCAQHDLELEQLDIKTAFLNGELPGELFMRCPPGFETPGKVWRLHKAIYGLKQAAQTWYETMKRQLHEKGFSVADSDPCLYIAHLGGSLLRV